MAANLWIEPFRQALEDSRLGKRLYREAKPVIGPVLLPLPDLRGALKDALEACHVACGQGIEVIWEALRLGLHHAEVNYASPDDYRRTRYLKDPYSKEPVVRALTGEAGVGKSDLFEAIHRLVGDVVTIDVGGDFGDVPTKRCISIEISLGTGLLDLMNQIGEALGLKAEYAKTSRANVLHLRRQLYAAGVCLLLVDELQFITSSKTANAALTRLLYFIQKLGIPALYGINYSAGHLLKKRPEQDRQRFLTQPLILLPALSQELVGLLAEYKKVFGKTLAIDPKRDAAMLNYWSGGKKRLLRELFDSACSPEVQGNVGTGPITMKTLEKAFDSTAFSEFRRTIVNGRKSDSDEEKDKDLICPFALPETAAELLAKRTEEEAKTAQREAAAKAAIAKARKVSRPAAVRNRRPRATPEDLLASFST